MRHYAQYNESGKLIAIGTGPGGIEITEEEYNRLLTEIRTKAALVDSLYNGEITIEEIPIEWREEIQHRVDERGANEPEPEEAEATEEDFISALSELGVTVNEEG